MGSAKKKRRVSVAYEAATTTETKYTKTKRHSIAVTNENRRRTSVTLKMEAADYEIKLKEREKIREEKKKKKTHGKAAKSRRRASSVKKPVTAKNTLKNISAEKEAARLEWQKMRGKRTKTKIEKRTRKKIGIVTRLKRKIPCFVDSDFELKGFALETVKLLHLNKKDLIWLRYHFNQIDLDDSGEIDYDELLEYLGSQRSSFTDKLFHLIDLDGNGFIDFNEYVQLLSTFGMYKKDEILRFAFDCFDKDASGAIDEDEFQDLAKHVQGDSPMFPGNFKRALEEFDKNDDGLIDFGEFREMNKKFPMMLYPAFQLQDRVQKATLGERKWNHIMINRNLEMVIKHHMATHGGAMPREPIGMKFRRILSGRPNPYKLAVKDADNSLSVKKHKKGDQKRKLAKKDRKDVIDPADPAQM